LQSPIFHRIAAKTYETVSSIQNKSKPLIEDSAKRAEVFAKTFKENLEKESKKAGWK